MDCQTATPPRVQLSRAPGWRMPANAIKIDRSTPWGNKFAIYKDGRSFGGSQLYRVVETKVFGVVHSVALAESIAAYKVMIFAPNMRRCRDLIRVAFRNKAPACWCALDMPCHGDVIREIAATPLEDGL